MSTSSLQGQPLAGKSILANVLSLTLRIKLKQIVLIIFLAYFSVWYLMSMYLSQLIHSTRNSILTQRRHKR